MIFFVYQREKNKKNQSLFEYLLIKKIVNQKVFGISKTTCQPSVKSPIHQYMDRKLRLSICQVINKCNSIDNHGSSKVLATMMSQIQKSKNFVFDQQQIKMIDYKILQIWLWIEEKMYFTHSWNGIADRSNCFWYSISSNDDTLFATT